MHQAGITLAVWIRNGEFLLCSAITLEDLRDSLSIVTASSAMLVRYMGASSVSLSGIGFGRFSSSLTAVNYRLAPQYPFPCAIQDLLAACECRLAVLNIKLKPSRDLFLIRPPEGAAHRPVRPEHIVIAGDSAGGGLSLALLQVIRDSGLPAPAGGVLISPWCDLTHSFPSILTNTDTVRSPSFRLPFCLTQCPPSGRETSYWPFSAQTQSSLASAFERRQLQGTQRPTEEHR
jgi:hypothetical protein